MDGGAATSTDSISTKRDLPNKCAISNNKSSSGRVMICSGHLVSGIASNRFVSGNDFIFRKSIVPSKNRIYCVLEPTTSSIPLTSMDYPKISMFLPGSVAIMAMGIMVTVSALVS
ncbi:hypothetical protein EJ04DRAFT_566025 [Polyplosphaeria fusca]|uniref:Uncharacterized protein n=1 Tax=Polyplosphaeria fusca TaxID=682080 RepID=A0A9P4QWA9_9PLEO|nr:hypothetical protein EJ04DRAFT_566025 [Polyplosphaeria fusca]